MAVNVIKVREAQLFNRLSQLLWRTFSLRSEECGIKNDQRTLRRMKLEVYLRDFDSINHFKTILFRIIVTSKQD